MPKIQGLKMRGMNENSGGHCEGIAHLKQSIENILSTPIGTRVMRRDYGSNLFKRIDNPTNGDLIADIYSDVVTASYNFEPRFELLRVNVYAIEKGRIILDIEGRYLANGQIIKLERIEIKGKT